MLNNFSTKDKNKIEKGLGNVGWNEILDDLAMGSFTVKVIAYWISPGRKWGAQ